MPSHFTGKIRRHKRDRADILSNTCTTSGLWCWQVEINSVFCNSECFPEIAKIVEKNFEILMCGVCPLIVSILFLKNRHSIIRQLAQISARPPTFSTAWGVILSAVILLVYMTLNGFTLGFAVLHTEMTCYKKGHRPMYLGLGILIATVSIIITSIVIIAASKLPTNIPVPKFLTFFWRIKTFYCLSEKSSTENNHIVRSVECHRCLTGILVLSPTLYNTSSSNRSIQKWIYHFINHYFSRWISFTIGSFCQFRSNIHCRLQSGYSLESRFKEMSILAIPHNASIVWSNVLSSYPLLSPHGHQTTCEIQYQLLVDLFSHNDYASTKTGNACEEGHLQTLYYLINY